MSQSPLARQSRKSLSAFSRAPSQLSRSTARADLIDSPSPSGSVSPTRGSPSPVSASTSTSTSTSKSTSPSRKNAYQNAFATPTRDYDTPTRKPRMRHSMGVGMDSPSTPTRIIYSPYATPPVPLSKSSSVPFDMAANLRAAKAAEEKRLRSAVAGDDSTSRQKKQRFVRKKPIWQRAIEWPGSVVDSAIFVIPTSVDEMLPPARFANPIALFLCVVQWLLLAPLRAPAVPDGSVINQGGYRSGIDDRWGRYAEQAKAPRRGAVGARTAFIISFILLLLSTANAVWLFTRYRTYDLLLRSASDPISSPNASPVPAPRANMQTSTEDAPTSTATNGVPNTSAAEKYARMALKCLWIMTKWAARSLLSAFGARPPASSAGFRSDDRIQCLRVWDPPEFCLAFFCAFAPSAPIVAYFLTNSNPFIAPILHAVTAFLLSHLAACFSQLVKDRQLLSAEVMREYDRRFVYKHVFAHTVDRCVGTSDP